MGETPNLAARLQQLAAPGTIILADSPRRLLAQLFHLRDLGARALHGFPAPVRAWQVAGEGRTTGRFEARHSGDLTPLVGREHEVALLLDRWRLAHEGEGQAVLLAGEPGVGKSRLAQAVRQRLGDERHVRLLYQCSPQHTGSALHPVAAQLEHAAGFRRDDAPGARLAKLKALLAQGVLNRLGRRHTATLAQRVSVKALPPEILDEIVARTDGAPLFVEELTRTVLESGLLERVPIKRNRFGIHNVWLL